MAHESEVQARMREDWNARALEDAHYYVAFGERGQTESGFQDTAGDVVRGIEWELRRLESRPEGWVAIEIGCGPGRLLRPLSRHFREIHGVDVSDEMVRIANQRLAGVPNARAHVVSGSDLAPFPSDFADFVYTYAVFQHIPDAGVVFGYLADVDRVLRPGGILKAHFNGLPKTAPVYDTWSGVRISAEELAAWAAEHDFQLLCLEGEHTQYMWATMRKREQGWSSGAALATASSLARIRRITNAYSSEPVVPSGGRFACASLWLEGLTPDADLNHLSARIDAAAVPVSFIGPADPDGLVQVNVPLPAGIPSGLRTVQLVWNSEPASEEAILRVIPPAPPVPRVKALSDGVNLLSLSKITSGTVKLAIEELDDPGRLAIDLGGQPPSAIDVFCTDPVPPRYEINLTLPALSPGSYPLTVQWGRRTLGVWPLEIG